VGANAAVCAWLATCTPLTKSRTVAPSKVVARCVQALTGIGESPNVFWLPEVHVPPPAGRLPLSVEAKR